MGVTEWEFSMRTKTKMCKATVNVMSFETESIDRHPFWFTEEEHDEFVPFLGFKTF